jgi:hypothetical protein
MCPVSCDVRRGRSPEELPPGAGRLLPPSAYVLAKRGAARAASGVPPPMRAELADLFSESRGSAHRHTEPTANPLAGSQGVGRARQTVRRPLTRPTTNNTRAITSST